MLSDNLCRRQTVYKDWKIDKTGKTGSTRDPMVKGRHCFSNPSLFALPCAITRPNSTMGEEGRKERKYWQELGEKYLIVTAKVGVPLKWKSRTVSTCVLHQSSLIISIDIFYNNTLYTHYIVYIIHTSTKSVEKAQEIYDAGKGETQPEKCFLAVFQT